MAGRNLLGRVIRLEKTQPPKPFDWAAHQRIVEGAYLKLFGTVEPVLLPGFEIDPANPADVERGVELRKALGEIKASLQVRVNQ